MRAAGSPVLVGVSTRSRTYRPVPVTGWLVTLAVLAVTLAAVVQVVPLVLTSMAKSRVFKVAASPPAPAWRMVTAVTSCDAPRSTCSHRSATLLHHRSVRPPVTVPLTALAGPSSAVHGVDEVAGLFSARLTGGGGVPGVPLTSSS